MHASLIKHPHHDGPAGTANSRPPRPPPRPPEKDSYGLPKHHQKTNRWDWSAGVGRDPLLHKSIVRPPCPIRTGQNETPKQVRSYSHNPELPAYLLRMLGRRFRTSEEGKVFYNRYARHAGFGIKTGQSNGRNKYIQCTREGEHTLSSPEPERRRFNNSKRCKCRALIRL